MPLPAMTFFGSPHTTREEGEKEVTRQRRRHAHTQTYPDIIFMDSTRYIPELVEGELRCRHGETESNLGLFLFFSFLTFMIS